MSKKRSDKEFIADMLISCTRISDYTKNLNYSDFYDK